MADVDTTPEQEVASSENATPESGDAEPKKRRGPKKCESCGEKRAAGGDPKQLGEMTKLCPGCSVNMLAEGRCPMCRKGLKTQHHEDNCTKPVEEQAA